MSGHVWAVLPWRDGIVGWPIRTGESMWTTLWCGSLAQAGSTVVWMPPKRVWQQMHVMGSSRCGWGRGAMRSIFEA
eukprot:13302766-Alexandrium_andersonii.AAC.1